MSPPGRGARGDQAASAPTPPSVGETTASVSAAPPRRYDGRAVALRRIARHQLDELLAGGSVPLVLGTPIDWHATHMDLGAAERAAIGRELATAGWVA